MYGNRFDLWFVQFQRNYWFFMCNGTCGKVRNNMCVGEWSNIKQKVLVSIDIWHSQYNDGIGVFFFATSLALCIVYWTISSLCRCAYPIPFHLYQKAVPRDPNILSLENSEQNCVICVGHVMGDEKYECEILNVVIRESKKQVEKVCCNAFNGSLLGILYLYL